MYMKYNKDVKKNTRILYTKVLTMAIYRKEENKIFYFIL